MRFVDFKKPGSPDVLFENEGPIPEPGSKEILVQVKAAGVNRPDLSQSRSITTAAWSKSYPWIGNCRDRQ